MSMVLPNYLVIGDRIRIVAPAKALPENGVQHTVDYFTNAGFEVLVGRNVYAQHGGFAGTDLERQADVQEAINDPLCKAILLARGGYGTVRIVDELDYSALKSHPKWFCGFSDITYFHGKANFDLNLASIHSTVPLKITKEESTQEATKSLLDALRGKIKFSILQANELNLKGKATGKLVGGNLAVFHGMLSQFDVTKLKDCILFLEDVNEEMYQIDRNLMNLKRAGVFDQISGCIVGGFTGQRDSKNWFPKTIPEQLFYDILKECNVPVCFNYPAGHVDYNLAMIFGAKIRMKVDGTVNIKYC